MATESRLESSLRRSASLGLEVLRRASRRNVDWSDVRVLHTHTDAQMKQQAAVSVQRDCPPPSGLTRRPLFQTTHAQLDEAFDSVADFMAHTTHQCTRFYQSQSRSDRSHMESNHVLRFHSCSAPGPSSSAAKRRVQSASDDFSIKVAAGTYSVTASVDESEQQTQVVSLTPRESVRLTFSL